MYDYITLNNRCNELIKTIAMINSYDPLLRNKYYPLLKHSIALLMQYTKQIEELTV